MTIYAFAKQNIQTMGALNVRISGIKKLYTVKYAAYADIKILILTIDVYQI
jgi:hypothetical protein